MVGGNLTSFTALDRFAGSRVVFVDVEFYFPQHRARPSPEDTTGTLSQPAKVPNRKIGPKIWDLS